MAGKTGDIRAARRAAEVALKQLGQYVNSVADGDEAILEKSGFPLSKVPSPHGDIPAPDKVGAELNADGSFTLGFVTSLRPPPISTAAIASEAIGCRCGCSRIKMS